MPEVTLDGERIEFSGPPPQSVAELLAVIEPVLAQAGRVLAGLTIDGAAFQDGMPAEAYGQTRCIEVCSLSVAEAVARVATGCSAALSELHTRGEALAGEVLRVGWTEARSPCVAFAESLGRALQEAGALAPHLTEGGGSELLAGAVTSLEHWLDPVQTGDAAAVCLRLHHELLPALLELKRAADVLGTGGRA